MSLGRRSENDVCVMDAGVSRLHAEIVARDGEWYVRDCASKFGTFVNGERTMERVLAHFEGLSQQFLGYELSQVLLLHANELNADVLPALVDMLRARMYTFVSLDDALEDPAYRLPEAPAARGLSWLHRWMLAKGLPMQPEPTEPPFVRELFNAVRR